MRSNTVHNPSMNLGARALSCILALDISRHKYVFSFLKSWKYIIIDWSRLEEQLNFNLSYKYDG